ncbi:hypothetical protein BGZ75_002135, partial [Mortierella antarctica]
AHKLTKKHVNDGKLRNPIADAFKQGRAPITRTDFMVALIKFIISNKLPMSLVEDPSFQSLLNIPQSAQSDDIVKLPKKDSFKSQIQDHHQKHHQRVKQELAHVPRLSFTLDGWTSKFRECFMCVTAHWLTDTWQYKEIILGFEPLQGSHTAKALMDCFVQV